MPASPSTASPQNAAPWMRSGIWFLKPETLRAHSFEVWKNIFVLAHAFCVQALFTESYQIPINPVSSQLWRTAKTILWPFWEGHPTSNGNTVIAEKEKKKNLPPSFTRTLPHLDLGRSQPTFFLLHPSDWCWGMARGFRKPLCGLAQAKPRLVCEKSRGQSNTCLWSARLHGLQERPL